MDPMLQLLILVGSVVALIICPVLFIEKRKVEKTLSATRQQAARFQEQVGDLEKEIDPLRQYQGIVDAQAEAGKIHESTRKAALAMIEKTKQVTARVEAESKEKLSEARMKAKELREKAQGQLDQAAAEARRIEEEAKAQARQIAGDAFEAKGKAEMYEKTVRAMKNIIKGYGDEYLIPSRSVLDDLADDFEHKKAGQELKRARQHSKAMVRNGLAATCEYVDKNKHTTAVHFVLDAFNGKTDSALSRVRHDNYGKLEQEIKDAYHLVNQTGEAFRNAQILPLYLQARLDELKWAVAVNELKLQAREEQRRIREAMREEEKARREYEQAIKKAEKEEKSILAEMKEAQKQLETANEEQRLRFEQQLQELQQKLEEAEEKNKRALSMAQQTRRGHVYVISNIGSFGENVFKIGMTRRLEPTDRVRELGDASVPFPFDIHAMLYDEDAPALEAELHRVFRDDQVNMVNGRKEFFNANLASIRQVVDNMGVEAHWTMEAEAAQYRETVTIRDAAERADQISAA